MPPQEAFGRFSRPISGLMPLGQADAWLTFWLTRTPLFEYRASPAVALAQRLAQGPPVANQAAFLRVPAKDGPDYN